MEVPIRRTRPVIVSHAEPDEDRLLVSHLSDEEDLCPLCSRGVRPETVPLITPRAAEASEAWNRESAAKAQRRNAWKT